MQYYAFEQLSIQVNFKQTIYCPDFVGVCTDIHVIDLTLYEYIDL